MSAIRCRPCPPLSMQPAAWPTWLMLLKGYHQGLLTTPGCLCRTQEAAGACCIGTAGVPPAQPLMGQHSSCVPVASGVTPDAAVPFTAGVSPGFMCTTCAHQPTVRSASSSTICATNSGHLDSSGCMHNSLCGPSCTAVGDVPDYLMQFAATSRQRAQGRLRLVSLAIRSFSKITCCRLTPS